MTQHQGTMEWGAHKDPTPLCLGVVSLLCSVSVRITPPQKKSHHLELMHAIPIWLNMGS